MTQPQSITTVLGMGFAYIPPGTFMMGSPEDEPGRDDDEKRHQVTLTWGYYLQTTLVTQGQWEAVMGNNPSYFKEAGPNAPVEQVSWDDVQVFIRNLNQLEGSDRFRLPTEAEWEYACRAGTETPFWTGRCLGTDQANYDGNYPLAGCPKGEYRKTTTPVKTFPPNPWGLYDMHGNVWEWCNDWFGQYPDGPVTDPTGPSTDSDRVLRGGSWYGGARNCRSTDRGRYSPGYRSAISGFRLVMIPRPQESQEQTVESPYDPKSRYYDAGGIETLAIIRAKLTSEQYRGFLLGNLIKYAARANFKGKFTRDIEKAGQYAQWLHLEQETKERNEDED